jgi:hypothetical protein
MQCKRNISDQEEVVARVCLFENLKSNWQNMNEFQRMNLRSYCMSVMSSQKLVAQLAKHGMR